MAHLSSVESQSLPLGREAARVSADRAGFKRCPLYLVAGLALIATICLLCLVPSPQTHGAGSQVTWIVPAASFASEDCHTVCTRSGHGRCDEDAWPEAREAFEDVARQMGLKCPWIDDVSRESNPSIAGETCSWSSQARLTAFGHRRCLVPAESNRTRICPCVQAQPDLLLPGDQESPVASGSVANPVWYGDAQDWCDCGTGTQRVRVWPGDDAAQAIELNNSKGDPTWLIWRQPVRTVHWQCDGMERPRSLSFLREVSYWSVQFLVSEKEGLCSKTTGQVVLSGWMQATYNTSIVVMAGEGAYECTAKIPVLLRTHNGTILAFAEARKGSCADDAPTDLVMKRSEDGGVTWSALTVVRTEKWSPYPTSVVGNAAPVQLSLNSSQHPGRILLPHCRNNSDVWLMYSDDDGRSWSRPRRLPGTVKPSWKWVGLGPPGSIQLRSGRVLVPSYHGELRAGIVNNLVHGHVMISDDDGDSWRLAAANGYSRSYDSDLNENQAVELQNGSVLVNGRSFATLTNQHRLQVRSDDAGETWTPTRYVDLPQPINGCEGSTVSTGRGNPPVLLFSGPDDFAFRGKTTLWSSRDEGASWQKFMCVDRGPSGYSSLQIDGCGPADKRCDALLLYESESFWQELPVQTPKRHIFRRIPLDELWSSSLPTASAKLDSLQV